MTNIEQRLRAAFAAADTALRDLDAAPNRGNAPIGRDVDNPADVTTGRGGQGRRRDDTGERRPRRGLGRFAPLAAAAACVALVAGIAWTVAERHTPPDANTNPSRTGVPSLSPTRPPTTASAAPVLRPLPGPGVSQARLLPGGHGYVLTGTRLLTTTDYASSWIDQTPAGVSAAQLADADVQTFDDTHAWLAVPGTNTTGALTATVYRRGGAVWQKATATATGLPTMPGKVRTYLSFATKTDGWLAIAAQVTTTGSGALLRTTDGGATWSLVASSSARTAPLPGVGPVDFVTPTVGWITEPWTGRTWMTRTGGATWTAFTLPSPAGQARDLAKLLALPQRSGPRLVTAVTYAQPVSGTADVVVLYTSSDNGTSWNTLASVPTTGNADVAFAAAPDQDTQVLLSLNITDVGAAPSWTVSLIQGGTVNAASTSTVPADVVALAAGDATHLWAVVQSNGCTNGKNNCFASSGLFTTSNAGRDWTLARPPT